MRDHTMHRMPIALLTLALTIAAAHPARADDPPAAPTAGFRAEFLKQLADVESKLVDLAGAVPQNKYTWRPGKDVRSVSEVYLHVAAGNYAVPGFGGFKAPAGVELATLEKSTTERAKVIETLKQSFAFVREVALRIPDADLDKPVKLFGGMESTMLGMLLTIATHQHEHLGQSIAYARMNGVVPPWTAARQAKTKSGS